MKKIEDKIVEDIINTDKTDYKPQRPHHHPQPPYGQKMTQLLHRPELTKTNNGN